MQPILNSLLALDILLDAKEENAANRSHAAVISPHSWQARTRDLPQLHDMVVAVLDMAPINTGHQYFEHRTTGDLQE